MLKPVANEDVSVISSDTKQDRLCTVCLELLADMPTWHGKCINLSGTGRSYGHRAPLPDDVFRQWLSSYDMLTAGSSHGCGFCAEVLRMERDYEATWFSTNGERVVYGPVGPWDDDSRIGAQATLLEGEKLFSNGEMMLRLEPTFRQPFKLTDLAELNLSVHRDLGNGKVGWDSIGSFNVMAERGNAAAQYITRQPLDFNMRSDVNFTRAREWIVDCLHSHKSCSNYCATDLPRRIIDVGVEGNTPRLCINMKQRASYIALSYCWGGPQTAVATTRSMENLKNGIDVSSLPETLQDAIIVTRKLGQRFLWIDALCIVQDQDIDKATEISRMHDIYANALVTICASAPSRCTDGFLKDYTATFPRSVSVPYECPGSKHGTVILRDGIRFPVEDHPLDTRSWAFQESYLSKRMLVYGSFLWFRCHQQNWSPANCEILTGTKLSSYETYMFESGRRNMLETNEVGFSLLRLEAADINLQWMLVVRFYTERKLTEAADKLPALAGAASTLASRSGHQYVAGLWIETLFFDLNWEVSQRDRYSRPTWRAPSWSWASIDGVVTYLSLHDQLEWESTSIQHGFSKRLAWKTFLDIIECYTVPLFEQSPFGQIKGSTLTVKGYLASVNHVDGSSWSLDGFECLSVKDASGKPRRLRVVLDSIDDLDYVRGSHNSAINEISENRSEATSLTEFWALPVALICGRINGLILEQCSAAHFRRVGQFKGDIVAGTDLNEWEAFMAEFESVTITII